MSLSVFYHCICAFVCGCHGFNPSLYRLSPFLVSYVAVSGPCHSLKFYTKVTGPDTCTRLLTNHP